MLLRVNTRREILTQRDAMVVSLQYGLGARNQEVWGLRWASLAGEFAWVMEVLSSGQLTEWGKTEHSTQRRTALPGVLREDLVEWRAALRGAGHPARELDFIIPGDLSGAGHGALDPRTGACHFSENQARSWGARFFTPAVKKVAQRPEFFPILGATPYSLRRGGISLRLRAEDPQTVASECGTRSARRRPGYSSATMRTQADCRQWCLGSTSEFWPVVRIPSRTGRHRRYGDTMRTSRRRSSAGREAPPW